MFIKSHFYSAASGKWRPPGKNHIRRLMDKAGWDIDDFASRVKATPRTIYFWLEGRTNINYSSWCVLCEQAGVSAIWTNDSDAAAKFSLEQVRAL